MASSVGWLGRSAGYVGVSDGWQTLSRGEDVRTEFDRAENGNVALTGTLNLTSTQGRAALAIGFGVLPEEAALRTLLSLQDSLPRKLESYCADWRAWQQSLLPLDEPTDCESLNRYRISTAVLASHRDDESGAIIAGLSVPWGFSKGDDDLGGYHLVWPRDLVETAGGLLAAGATEAAKGVLKYLAAVQEEDGHWSQNSWLDGRPYWGGIQIDETGFPILLYDMLFRAGAISGTEPSHYAPMIRAAAGYIVRNGPVTQQDRWEEDAGYSPFTLAVEIAALVAAAEAMTLAGETEMAKYLLETADGWNEQIEAWTYVADTKLARRLGTSGYYMRVGSAVTDGLPMALGHIVVRNRSGSDGDIEAGELVSPDALALVRFGLRAADDPRIVDTVKVIDSLLRRDLPEGSYWYRYNNDGYGEHLDGSPFDGTGIGRLWPLLTGERAHYELAAGRTAEARRLLAAFEAAAGPGGLLPEQIWDSDDIQDRELFLGRPSGSAMPLVWAHAEHIKLLRSLRDGVVFDRPPQTYQRYVASKPPPAPVVWRPHSGSMRIASGCKLRIELNEPAVLHWSSDDWKNISDSNTQDTRLGTHICDLPTDSLTTSSAVVFTMLWTLRNQWAGIDYRVDLATTS